MQIRALFFLLFLSFIAGCNSYKNSPEVICVRNGSHEIKSIDLSSDYSDLSFLKKIISDDSVKIVMLGEQTHFDGTTFIGKSKLVKFLHEQCGFDVLAFESGYYDCDKGWELIKQDKDYDWIKGSIFGLWAYSKEFIPLTDYLKSTLKSPNPVILSGFDDALTGSVSGKYLLSDFDKLNLLNPASEEHLQFEKLLKSLAPEYQASPENKPDTLSLINNFKLLDNILIKLDSLKMDSSSVTSSSNKEFWLNVISGLKIAYNSLYNMKNGVSVEQGSPASNKRDLQMADNLLWLLQRKYPGKKIIVWAANFHVMRNFKNIDFPEALSGMTKNTATMADVIYKYLGKKIYSITFTDYENYQSGSASDKAIEFYMDKAGYDYSFTNLRENPLSCLNSKFISRISGHIELNGKWSDVTDAIFFIKEINKSNLVN